MGCFVDVGILVIATLCISATNGAVFIPELKLSNSNMLHIGNVGSRAYYTTLEQSNFYTYTQAEELCNQQGMSLSRMENDDVKAIMMDYLVSTSLYRSAGLWLAGLGEGIGANTECTRLMRSGKVFVGDCEYATWPACSLSI